MRRQSFTYVDYVGRSDNAGRLLFVKKEIMFSNLNAWKIHYSIDKEEKSKSVSSRPVLEEELTKMLTAESMNKIIEGKRQGKPIPAPRTSIETQLRTNNIDDGTLKKPVIPEKPTTLPRPGSTHFKTVKINDPNDVKMDVSNQN